MSDVAQFTDALSTANWIINAYNACTRVWQWELSKHGENEYTRPALVLGVDPGGTTGLAMLLAINGRIADMHFAHTDGDCFGETYASGLWQRLTLTALITESFRVTAATASKAHTRLWSVEQIGIMRLLMAPASAEEFVESPPSSKRFASDQKLKALKLWRGGAGHAMDATRHGFVYLMRKRLIDHEMTALAASLKDDDK